MKQFLKDLLVGSIFYLAGKSTRPFRWHINFTRWHRNWSLSLADWYGSAMIKLITKLKNW